MVVVDKIEDASRAALESPASDDEDLRARLEAIVTQAIYGYANAAGTVDNILIELAKDP